MNRPLNAFPLLVVALLVVLAAWLLVPALAGNGGADVLLRGVPAVGAEEPTAVVLSTFSADIRGPSRALWTSSSFVLLLGIVVVRTVYRRRG